MTSVAHHTSQALSEWTKIFPRQATENYTSSVTFMKQLTVVAVSTITYLKNAFSEDNYTVDTLGGIKIRVLKNKCKDDLAQFLNTALSQAFEAFEKKYLDQIVLCFYEEECKPENLIEYHAFEYHYTDEGVTMSISSKRRDQAPTSVQYTLEDVRRQTVQLIRACVVMMQTYPQQLPETYDVSLRLYYNEDAPEGYQAPGFLSAPDADDPPGAPEFDGSKLGWVGTPFHRLVVRTFVRDSLRASREVIPSLNPPTMSQAQSDSVAGSERQSAGNYPLLRCSCTNYDGEDDHSALLTCFYCGTRQHAACYGLLEAQSVRVAKHCCVRCADQEPSRCVTDRQLAGITRKRECLAIFRRTLEWCTHKSAVSASDLRQKLGLTPGSANKLMKLLHQHGIITNEPDSEMTKVRINHDSLQEAINKHFQISEGTDIVDRLMEESFASQESQPDPVGDVLGPLKKVSLQNDSNIGRVIDPKDIHEKVIEDPTLKQYREALIMVDRIDDEMPLSGSHNPVQDIESIGKKPLKRKTDKDGVSKAGVKTKRAKAIKK